MNYRLYQMGKDDTALSVLHQYIQKYGEPPTVLMEVSTKLEEVKLPEDMNVVVKSIRIPKNMLLIGAVYEQE